jgi:hypothetical protein
MSLQLPFKNDQDNETYQVDLVTNIFSIMIIFLLIYIATQSVETPKNNTNYVKKDLDTENFTLLRQRFFRPFTDIYLVSSNGFYKMDLDAIAHAHGNTLEYENTLFEKDGAEVFVKSSHPRNQRDINSFLLDYTLKTSPSPQTYGLRAINAANFLAFVEENTYNQHKVAKFYIQTTALDNFVSLSEYLTNQGYKFRFQVQNKIKIRFNRDYKNFIREDHLR